MVVMALLVVVLLWLLIFGVAIVCMYTIGVGDGGGAGGINRCDVVGMVCIGVVVAVDGDCYVDGVVVDVYVGDVCVCGVVVGGGGGVGGVVVDANGVADVVCVVGDGVVGVGSVGVSVVVGVGVSGGGDDIGGGVGVVVGRVGGVVRDGVGCVGGGVAVVCCWCW